MEKLADIQCHDCDNDFFCHTCFSKYHKSSHFKSHSTFKITNAAEPVTSTANNFMRPHIEESDAELAPWQKFEKFNFPLDNDNDLFDQLRYYFQFMKESYLTINNIDESSQALDLVKMILD